MSIPFYRAFEDRHRGSRELIRERLQVYSPFIDPIIKLYPQGKALDLGCGRGEWLEILMQKGFAPLGVDLDQGMLQACIEMGLPVELDDALGALKKLPDESQTLVSGFHIAEHIPFDDLKTLVAEALRVLKPAGLLILETPNAENLLVGSQNFYLDPTHERPIPHLLLSFLTEYTGFHRSKLMRLQEPQALADGGPVDLMGVLGAVSPDYAIVAQKPASEQQLQPFNGAYDRHYGLALDALAQRYDAQIEARIEAQFGQAEAGTRQLADRAVEVERNLGDVRIRLENTELLNQELLSRLEHLANRSIEAERRLDEIDDNAAQLHEEAQASAVKIQQADVEIEELNRKLNESTNNAHHWWLQATALEARYEALLKSRSWRVTRPLRAGVVGIHRVAAVSKRGVKLVLRPLLVSLLRFAVDRPVFRQRVKRVLEAYPGLHSRLENFARHKGILPQVSSARSESVDTSPIASSDVNTDHATKLSPSARYVYTELKKAMKNKGPR